MPTDHRDTDESVMFASYGVIGAILLMGGTGYALDRWLATGPWFLLVGLAVGVSVAFYALVKTVQHR
jgi:F0F1-type ATP synthase assembly protein I